MEKLYTAEATATGGRNGHVASPNKLIDFDLRSPKALGGANDDYLNPEMLFAAGYSACFDNALNRVIRIAREKTGITSVKANVSIGKLDEMRFGLAVELEITIPGVDLEKAQSLAQQAHAICPYSNATRNNIEVKLTVKTGAESEAGV